MQPVLWLLCMLNTEHCSMNNGEFYICCCIKETGEATVSEQVEGGQEDREQAGALCRSAFEQCVCVCLIYWQFGSTMICW